MIGIVHLGGPAFYDIVLASLSGATVKTRSDGA